MYRIDEAKFNQGKSNGAYVVIHLKGLSVHGSPFEGDLRLEVDGREVEWLGDDFGDDFGDSDQEEVINPAFEDPKVGAEIDKAVAWANALPPLE